MKKPERPEGAKINAVVALAEASLRLDELLFTHAHKCPCGECQDLREVSRLLDEARERLKEVTG